VKAIKPRTNERGDHVTLPNFLIIGAAKSGTASLYHYLGQHPQVYMSPVKEPNFFALEGHKLDFRAPEAEERINRWSVTSLDAYRALFEGVTTEKAIGEASPMYLYSPEAPERIRRYTPDARLIVVLRDPVERAYSSYMHLRRNGRESLDDFVQALEAEEMRMASNWEWIWHYKNMGFYCEQLKRYYERFDRDQIRVYLHEDLKKDSLGVSREVYEFVGADSSFVPDTSLKYNVSGVPMSRTIFNLIKRPHPVKNALKPLFPERFRRPLVMGLWDRILVKPPLPAEVRGRLVEEYRQDILGLQDLIQRDLSGWLDGRASRTVAGEVSTL
jgi:Sulfotransferase family